MLRSFSRARWEIGPEKYSKWTKHIWWIYHEGDTISTQAVCQKLGEFAVTVGYVTVLFPWVTQGRNTIAWNKTKPNVIKAAWRFPFPPRTRVLICPLNWPIRKARKLWHLFFIFYYWTVQRSNMLKSCPVRVVRPVHIRSLSTITF